MADIELQFRAGVKLRHFPHQARSATYLQHLRKLVLGAGRDKLAALCLAAYAVVRGMVETGACRSYNQSVNMMPMPRRWLE